MADNFLGTVYGGGSANFAAKDIGGVLYGRQLISGPDGSDCAFGTTIPDNGASAYGVRVIGQDTWNCSFSDVGASVIAEEFVQTPKVGTGVSYSQGSGALAIVSGTTANAEFLARSVRSWRGALMLSYSMVASQRIANNNFGVILADLIGEGLAVTVNSATSITVTKTAHGYTAKNVGQFMFIGGITGVNGVPGRYAIASIPTADTINFTVAGWPATGSGTLTLFGHSHVKHIYSGTSVTNYIVNCQRRGWCDADTTSAVGTTASPGHIVKTQIRGRSVEWADTLRASSATPNITTRASRFENLPDDNLDLYLFLWSYNGTTAPASSTTWTISFCAIEKFAALPVFDQGSSPQGSAWPKPVNIASAPTLTTNVASISSSAVAIGDVGIQYRATATGAASTASILSPATPAGASIKASAGRLLGWSLANTSAALRSVKLFNATAVTMGTTGAIFEIDIPAGARSEIQLPGGIAFGIGIMWAVTSGKGLTDNTATGLAVNDVSGAVFFA